MIHVSESEWKWFGFPAHYILRDRCQFHMATQVGAHLVSTIGGMIGEDPDDRNWRPVGVDRLFETMVFRIIDGSQCSDPDCECGTPNIDGMELETIPAQNAGDAQRNHMATCRKWAWNTDDDLGEGEG